METYEVVKPLVIYAAVTRDRTQGFLHTGDFGKNPDVETVAVRRERRMTLAKQ